MRCAALAALAACGDDIPGPSTGAPYAIVDKLAGYQRRMFADDAALAAFASGVTPDTFTLTLHTFTDGVAGSIFVRERRDGAWWSSSPSPGTIVDETPRIEPACDGCHDDHAEALGAFTLAALREAAVRDRTARIDCPRDGTEPCDADVYRTFDFR
jgi:hypothetical protein